MVYISIVTEDLVAKVSQSKPVSYYVIRKRSGTHNQAVRKKELRSYFATYLRQHEILAEYTDLLQGCIPKSVFVKHYLKIESIKELLQKVNAVAANLERSLVS
jgi:intergrase/recombinase